MAKQANAATWRILTLKRMANGECGAFATGCAISLAKWQIEPGGIKQVLCVILISGSGLTLLPPLNIF